MLITPADRIKGIESYYFARKLAEIEKINQSGGLQVINLGIGSPDLNPPLASLDMFPKSLYQDGAHKYQPYRGIASLRNAFQQWYQKHFRVNLNAATEILPLIGSKEGIMHLSMAFLNDDDQVLVPNPGYPAYSAITQICGAEAISYNLIQKNNWWPDFSQLEQNDLSKVKLMWVNYPHMPTGAKASFELFQQLVEFGRKYQILICHDNPYTFILNEMPLSIFQAEGAKDVAVELTSLSKNYNMAGWRIGALAANQEIIDTVLKFKSNMDSGMFRPLQEAAVQALNQPESWHQNLDQAYKARRVKAWEILNLLNCTFDKQSAGLFVWGKVPGNYESGEVISDKILKEARVFITPGFIFGSNGQQYIRISLCSSEEILEDAIDRIKHASIKKL